MFGCLLSQDSIQKPPHSTQITPLLTNRYYTSMVVLWQFFVIASAYNRQHPMYHITIQTQTKLCEHNAYNIITLITKDMLGHCKLWYYQFVCRKTICTGCMIPNKCNYGSTAINCNMLGNQQLRGTWSCSRVLGDKRDFEISPFSDSGLLGFAPA